MREIDYTKSDERIKKVCKEAFNELKLPEYSTYRPLTIRQRIKLNTAIIYTNKILTRI